MRTLALLLLLACPVLRAQNAAPGNSHLLRATTIPELTLNRATLQEAIAALREKTKSGDAQVNFVVTPQAEALDKVVSLDLRGVNGMDAFVIILNMTDTQAELRRNSVWILPKEE